MTAMSATQRRRLDRVVLLCLYREPSRLPLLGFVGARGEIYPRDLPLRWIDLATGDLVVYLNNKLNSLSRRRGDSELPARPSWQPELDLRP
jgi:hypothetical protein